MSFNADAHTVRANGSSQESFWECLKVGRLCGRRFATRRQAMDEVIDWMTFYNHRRIHSTLGYFSPMQFEKSWHAAKLLNAALLSR